MTAMSGTKFALGVELGTEAGRVLLVRVDTGEEIAQTQTPYPHGVMDRRLPDDTPLGADWALQDPRDYLLVLEQGIPDALREGSVAAADVIGIGVASGSCALLPVQADGTPLCHLAWYRSQPHAWAKLPKHKAQVQASRITQVAAQRQEEFLAAYGGTYPAEAFFSKVLQIVDEAPEIYAVADRFIEAGDWLVWQMTGREARSECAAGCKAMWIKGCGFPSPSFFRELEPRLEQVATQKIGQDFLPLGARAGSVTPQMAQRTRLHPGTPVSAAVIDTHAAVPACGVTEPGRLAMIMGGSLSHLLLAEGRRSMEGICTVVQDGIVPGWWGYEAGQPAAGDLYGWFFRTAVPAEVQEQAERRGMTPAEWITTEAWRLKPGQSGLLALDWWDGSRSVLQDGSLSGVILGLTLATRPEEIYRALIEGTALGTRTILEAFEAAGLAANDIVACGGLAERSPVVLQIFADATGREIRLPRSFQAAGLGAAMHGAVAGGYYKDLPEAARHMTQLLEGGYRPNPAAREVYNRLYAEYRCLHDHFGRGGNEVLKRLRAIRREVI
jgi:L-ribulokinase